MAKNIKKCRYASCKHDNKEIDIDHEEFIQVGSKYYHKDCKGQCKYKFCRHNDHEIDFQKDDYIIADGNCWHSDCKKESDTVKEIVDFWYRNISDSESDIRNLYCVLKTLLNKGRNADYILFALRKSADVIKHPPGLYYVLDNYKIVNAWKKKLIDEQMKDVKFDKPQNNTEPKFSAQAIGASSFSDIFGGKM